MIEIKVSIEGKSEVHRLDLKSKDDFLAFFDLIAWKGGDWEVVTPAESISDPEIRSNLKRAEFIKRIAWALFQGWTVSCQPLGKKYSLNMSKRGIFASMFQLDKFRDRVNELLYAIADDLWGLRAELELEKKSRTLHIRISEEQTRLH